MGLPSEMLKSARFPVKFGSQNCMGVAGERASELRTGNGVVAMAMLRARWKVARQEETEVEKCGAGRQEGFDELRTSALV